MSLDRRQSDCQADQLTEYSRAHDLDDPIGMERCARALAPRLLRTNGPSRYGFVVVQFDGGTWKATSRAVSGPPELKTNSRAATLFVPTKYT